MQIHKAQSTDTHSSRTLSNPYREETLTNVPEIDSAAAPKDTRALVWGYCSPAACSEVCACVCVVCDRSRCVKHAYVNVCLGSIMDVLTHYVYHSVRYMCLHTCVCIVVHYARRKVVVCVEYNQRARAMCVYMVVYHRT